MHNFFKQRIKLIFIVVYSLIFFSCNQEKKEEVNGDWIKGTEKEKLKKIEKQFRGFDMTMVETGYRYQELYWSGQDKNWEYADYQLEKIKLAIENGLERRPKRAKSAEHFLTNVLPKMKTSIANKDKVNFDKDFQTLTINCNNCHAMEKVSFFNVKIPENRQSPIKNE